MVYKNTIANKAYQMARVFFLRQNKHWISTNLFGKSVLMPIPVIKKQESNNSRELEGDMKNYVRSKYLLTVNFFSQLYPHQNLNLVQNLTTFL